MAQASSNRILLVLCTSKEIAIVFRCISRFVIYKLQSLYHVLKKYEILSKLNKNNKLYVIIILFSFPSNLHYCIQTNRHAHALRTYKKYCLLHKSYTYKEYLITRHFYITDGNEYLFTLHTHVHAIYRKSINVL